jgi:hypothetical protein
MPLCAIHWLHAGLSSDVVLGEALAGRMFRWGFGDAMDESANESHLEARLVRVFCQNQSCI